MKRYDSRIFILVTALLCSGFADRTGAVPGAAESLRFLTFLRTDRDAQAAAGLEVIGVLLERGDLEDAKGMAETMRGFRQAVAYYQLSEAAAVTGDEGLGEEYFQRAKGILVPMREREMEAVFLSRNAALGALGKLPLAEREISEVKAVSWKQAAGMRLFDYYPLGKLADKAREALSLDGLPTPLRAAMALHAAERLEAGGDTETAVALVEEVLDLVAASPTVETIVELHRGVHLLVKLGMTEDATALAEKAAALAQSISSNAYWKARDLRLAAEALEAAGLEAEAALMFEAIPNATTGLNLANYSEGGMHAAQAFLSRDEEALFDEACVHVLKFCAQHPHHRARAKAALDVLVAYMRNDREVPEAVRVELDRIAESITADPHYAGNATKP